MAEQLPYYYYLTPQSTCQDYPLHAVYLSSPKKITFGTEVCSARNDGESAHKTEEQSSLITSVK